MDGFNLGAAPQLSSGANPWGNISAAINQGLQTRKDDIEHQQDRAVVQQENQARIAAAKREQAQAGLKQILPMAYNNETYKKDPRVIGQIDSYYKDLGMPGAPRHPDNTIDWDSTKPAVDTSGDAYQKFISMAPGPAKTVAYKTLSQQFSGIPPEAATADAVITPKEANIIANLAEKRREFGIKETDANNREANKVTYQRAQMGLMDERGQKLMSDIAGTRASIALKQAETANIPQRLLVLQKNADTARQRADQMLTSGHLNRAMWNQDMSTMRDMQTQYHQMEGQKNDLERLQVTYQGQGVPDDDPRMTAVQDQLDAINKGMAGIKPDIDNIQNYLSKNVNDIITNNTMSQQSGKPSEVMGGTKRNTGTDPSNYDTGATYTDPNGGKWVKQANGKWLAK